MQNHGEGWCKVRRGCGTGLVPPGGTEVCGELRHKWQRLERIRDALSLRDLPNICDLCGGVLGSESSQQPSSGHCRTGTQQSALLQADTSPSYSHALGWALSGQSCSTRCSLPFITVFLICVLQFRCVYNGDDIQLYFRLNASHLSKTKAKFCVIKATK